MKQKFQVLLEWLKRPHGLGLVLIYIFTLVFIALALALVIISIQNTLLEILSYISYALAAISLGYTVYTIVIYAPTIKESLLNLMRKNQFVSSLLDNWGYRTVVFAGVSLIISVLYAIFNAVMGILSHSIWYGALALYYILLAALRSGIVFYHRQKKKGKVNLNKDNIVVDEKTQFQILELKKYRFCGILLVILPISLSFAILQMVAYGNAFIHYGWMIYAVAAYSFYKIVMAIINVVKATKSDDMLVRSLRCINLADAMVSILALQTTLLFTFSNGVGTGFANALTGAVVCALTLALGVYMIINANKKIKQIKTNNIG